MQRTFEPWSPTSTPMPHDSIVIAASRWLDLLKRNTVERAATLLSKDRQFLDLTQTQYFVALEWLASLGLLDTSDEHRGLANDIRSLAHSDLIQLAMTRALEFAEPPWLAAANDL